jgi:hypothetical protein
MTQDKSEVQTNGSPLPPAQGFSQPAYWILCISLILFSVILSGVPRAEFDLFWQLRAGQDMAGNHAIPHTDSFSWTQKGSPWVVHEWLALFLFWEVYSTCHGFLGLIVLKIAVISLTICILFTHLCWANGSKLIPAVLLAALAAMAASIGFEVRPQIFTYLFVTLVSSMVLRARANNYFDKKIWLLVPIYAIWANMHSGVIVGIFLLMAWSVGDLIDGANQAEEAERNALQVRGRVLLTISLACTLATLLTPYGIAEYVNFAQTLQNAGVINSISEWASPTLHDGSGRNLCFLTGILLTGYIFSRRFVLLGDVFIFLALLHVSLMSTRNIPLFALSATMVSIPYLQGILTRNIVATEDKDTKSSSIFGNQVVPHQALLAAIGLVIIALVSTHSSYSAERTSNLGAALTLTAVANNAVSTADEPVMGAQFIKAAHFPPTWKMYNSYDNGGYLIWRLPEFPVSIDSRADLYFGKTIDDYFKVNRLSFNWQDAFYRHTSDFVIAPSTASISKLLMSSKDWALVYAASPDLDPSEVATPEENTLIFVRRSPDHNAQIARIRMQCPIISQPDFIAKYNQYDGIH